MFKTWVWACAVLGLSGCAIQFAEVAKQDSRAAQFCLLIACSQSTPTANPLLPDSPPRAALSPGAIPVPAAPAFGDEYAMAYWRRESMETEKHKIRLEARLSRNEAALLGYVLTISAFLLAL